MTILPNNVAVVAGDTHHAVWCAEQGLVHDQWMAKIIKEAIRSKGFSSTICAVDVGANIGTLTMAMLESGCRVVAFEPNPEAADCLEYNCQGADIHRVALGENQGQCRIFRKRNASASYVTGPDMTVGDPVSDIIPVETLDSYNLKPGLLKIDAEGYEVRVLRGAKRTIATARPAIICEVSAEHLARYGYTPQDLFGFLGAYGYGWRILQPEARPGDPQYDIIALPK